MASLRANALPEKIFFIEMITRDISLDACIFDLIDNSIDGANRELGTKRNKKNEFKNFSISIDVTPDQFSISDNCGGIPVSLAQNSAFRLGRKKSLSEGLHTVGHYGIGMKRAIFKIGRAISVHSRTKADRFSCDIDVETWSKTKAWYFSLNTSAKVADVGTKILIKNLNSDVQEVISSEGFLRRLGNEIARDYSLMIQRGLRISLNGKSVPPLPFMFMNLPNKYAPARFSKVIDGVDVEIIAGIAGPLPDSNGRDSDLEDRDRYGWYVVCNDRVVLAADKSSKTGWGDGTRVWHPQYNGFIGIIRFDCDDPSKLPWTTTKRDIDLTSAVYREALGVMKGIAKKYAAFTARRKSAGVPALREDAYSMVGIEALQERHEMLFPDFPKKLEISVSFRRPREEVDQLREAYGGKSLTASEVGARAFDEAYKRRVL